MDDNVEKQVEELYASKIAYVWGLLFKENLHIGWWEREDEDISRHEATRRFTEMMIHKMPIKEGGRFLDIGSGLGGPAVDLAETKKCQVDGVNVSPDQIEFANQYAAAQKAGDRVTFHLANGMELPFEPEAFDAAWYIESFVHMPDYKGALSEVHRVLKNDGFLLFVDFPVRNPLKEEDRELLRQYFQLNTLITMEEFQYALEETGFEFLSSEDITKQSYDSWSRLSAEMEHYRDEIVGLGGEDLYNTVESQFNTFARFMSAHLDYRVITARKKRNIV